MPLSIEDKACWLEEKGYRFHWKEAIEVGIVVRFQKIVPTMLLEGGTEVDVVAILSPKQAISFPAKQICDLEYVRLRFRNLFNDCLEVYSESEILNLLELKVSEQRSVSEDFLKGIKRYRLHGHEVVRIEDLKKEERDDNLSGL